MPHRIPPAAITVPPSGFVIVSVKVTGPDGAVTRSKIAPQLRACVIKRRPVGAQSPVNPEYT